MRKITPKIAQRIIDDHLELPKAGIIYGEAERQAPIREMVLTLTTARTEQNPVEVLFPFQSILVEQATDTNTYIFMKFGSKESGTPSLRLEQRDGYESDLPGKAYLHWDAQPGKTITLKFFLLGRFKSGKQTLVNSGGVSINEGSSVTTQAKVTIGAATAAAIAPSDSTRKKTTLQNKTGAILWIGDSSVTNATGIEVPVDGIIYWQNTSALYGYSVLGGDVMRMLED